MKKCDEMLETVDLDFKRDAFANTLSRGQTQRLGLARVLLHDPQVLLLDEPLSGLDPRARIEMRNLMRRLGTMGKTVVVSSHILPELADICNKIGIIDKGELKVSAEVTDVMNQVREQTVLNIGVENDTESAIGIIQKNELVSSVEHGDGCLVVTLKNQTKDYSQLAADLINNGIGLKLFQEEEVSLESAFMTLTKGAGAKI